MRDRAGAVRASTWFTRGDRVAFPGKYLGKARRFRGEVVAVVPPWKFPLDAAKEQGVDLACMLGRVKFRMDVQRAEESYIISCRPKLRMVRPALYWPPTAQICKEDPGGDGCHSESATRAAGAGPERTGTSG